jgi:hypothetical protein
MFYVLANFAPGDSIGRGIMSAMSQRILVKYYELAATQ